MRSDEPLRLTVDLRPPSTLQVSDLIIVANRLRRIASSPKYFDGYLIFATCHPDELPGQAPACGHLHLRSDKAVPVVFPAEPLTQGTEPEPHLERK